MRVSYEVRERDGTLVAAAVQMELEIAIQRLHFHLENGRNMRIWAAGLFPTDGRDLVTTERLG